VSRVQVRDDLAWLDAVRATDLVFNLCEGIGGVSHLEYKVASALELAGVPYTGASAWTMTVCHRKPLLNAVLQAAGLPIPEWTVARANAGAPRVPLPAIVKPAAEDASVGIDQGSVVSTREALTARAARLAAQFGDVILQRYVHGRELAVGFVGDRTLPVSEIDFRDMPEGAWPILSFDAKWARGSAEDLGTRPVCPARLAPALARRVLAVARAAWQAVDGRGYGRVDLRLDAGGKPWIIEVNPNPDISTDAGLARMALAGGWSYADVVLRIVEGALAGVRRAARAPRRRQVARDAQARIAAGGTP
jgi:D-alanine-D-alanine ligase